MRSELRAGTGRGPGLRKLNFCFHKDEVSGTLWEIPCLESGAQSQYHPLRIFGFGVGKGENLKAEEAGSQELGSRRGGCWRQSRKLVTKITGAGLNRAQGHMSPGPGSCGTFGNKGKDCECATPRHDGSSNSWLGQKLPGT